ncbi:MAG TPA: beta-ketoacyl synthase N-terminal-like domain-containing protein [Bacteroidales bacterium]|nr:beta-ketoacyl synthase N-terminal-like domain-containing protein [Bacteroidales bacterium]
MESVVKNRAYINGIGLISPQKTAENTDFLSDIVEYKADYLKAIDPNFKAWIDPLAARRMSRLIKMGIVAAKTALADAHCEMPDAIITGTGLGSVEDTEKILAGMIAGETLTNPTPFMQSTYNTISSQIAINLKCHGYNSTYVHRAFSFESSLFDALMQLAEGTAEKVLAGGVDEMTPVHLGIVRRLGDWKMQPESNLKVLESVTPGALAGEGAGFFLLGNASGENSYCALSDVRTFYKPGTPLETAQHLLSFLTSNYLATHQVDLVITGMSGDRRYDGIYESVCREYFPEVPVAYYKHLCGEYHTSSAFALWLAANILKRQSVPDALLLNAPVTGNLKTILIWNHYRNVNHALILLEVI